MTPEERARMSELCMEIQSEKDYRKFEELMRQVTALMSAKESRFPESRLAPAGTAQKILHATATRTLKNPDSREAELVEIRLADAQPLYSEIRVENSFTDERGTPVALHPPTILEVRLRAPADHVDIRTLDKSTP